MSELDAIYEQIAKRSKQGVGSFTTSNGSSAQSGNTNTYAGGSQEQITLSGIGDDSKLVDVRGNVVVSDNFETVEALTESQQKAILGNVGEASSSFGQ